MREIIGRLHSILKCRTFIKEREAEKRSSLYLMFKYHSLRKLESASGPLRVVEKKTCLLVTVHFIYPGGQVLRGPFQAHRPHP